MTKPSIKRCTCVNKQRNSGNRYIRSKILEYHLDLWAWLNSVQMCTPTWSRWASNNYITRYHRWLESVGVRVAVVGSLRQVSKQVQQRSMMPRPMSYPACQQFDWYENINKPTIMPPSLPRRTGRKNAIEKTFLTTACCSPQATAIFFLKIRVLSVSFLWTPFFQTQRILVLCYSSFTSVSKLYFGESKVLEYFDNIRNRLAVSDAFFQGCERDEPYWTVKYRARLILSECYSMDLPLYLSMVLSLPELDQFIKVLATWAKILEPGVYSSVINCNFKTVW